MRRLATVASALVILAGLLVAPATAHSGDYCGHGTTSHRPWSAPWTKHIVTWKSSWNEGGQHWHLVYVQEWAQDYYTPVPC